MMSSVAIERLVEKSAEYFQNEVRAQEQAVSASKARTSFFTLPTELRTHIYEVVLTEVKVPRPDEHARREVERQVEIQRWQRRGQWDDTEKAPHDMPLKPTKRPALLAVIRQLRREALST